jgi:hypothetical protein
MTTNELFINMKKNITETTISEFKNHVTSNGYTQEEMETGGLMNTEFLKILYQLVTDFKKWDTNSGCTLKFTSGNDEYHKNNSPSSLHTTGNAVDIVLNTSACYDGLFFILNDYKKKYPGFNYLDERTKKSTAWTGAHVHISYRPNNPENFSSGGSSGGSTGGSTTSSFDELAFMNPVLDQLKGVGQEIGKQYDKTINKVFKEEMLNQNKKVINEIKRINKLMKD